MERHSTKQVWKHLRVYILSAIALAAAFLLLNLFGIGCPIKFLTGISCPGCGMTRATWKLLTLDLPAALDFHPLSVAMPFFAALWLCFTWTKKPTARRVVVIAAVASLIAVYLYRQLTGGDEVVVFTPRQGYLYRMAVELWQRILPQ
jgi:hypothetical protein